MLDITLLRKDLASVVRRLEARKSPQPFLDVERAGGVGGCAQGAGGVNALTRPLPRQYRKHRRIADMARPRDPVLAQNPFLDRAQLGNRRA